jgi:hypothetical protein
MSIPLAGIPRYLSPRQTATLAVLVIAALPLGCMGLHLGHSDAGLAQNGQVNLQPGQEVDVYFAMPYAGVPELVLSGAERCEVQECNGCCFRVRNNGSAARKLVWQATGLPAPVAPRQRSDRMLQRQQVQPPAPSTEAQDAPVPPVSIGEPR